MFKLSPEIYTVKNVASSLGITPRAVRASIKRTGAVRGVKVTRTQGMILFSEKQYNRIINFS